jgi:hypothetical protein
MELLVRPWRPGEGCQLNDRLTCFQILAASGQPFILNAVPKLAVNWFPGTHTTYLIFTP